MNPDRLLSEIQRVLEGRRDPKVVQRRLDAIVNRPGAAEALARVLRSGDVVDAQLAAVALPYAKSELVRRGLRRDARLSSGGRRALLLSSLTEDELSEVVEEVGDDADDWLIEAMGLFAVNDPGDFVEMLCESVPVVGVRLVEYVEKVRRAYAISASALYGPLLGRRLSREARRRVVAILGHEPGDEVRALLEKEQARATADDEQRTLRRERMRQSSLVIEGALPPAPKGLALLSPVGPRDTAALEILEDVGEGRGVATTVLLPMGTRAETYARPLDGTPDEARARAGGEFVELSLGQARWLLESLPAERRRLLAPVLERLEAATPEPLERPAPEDTLSPSDAAALAREEVFSRWRPLSSWVSWPDEVLDAPADEGSFPAAASHVAERAREELARCLAVQKLRERYAAGLRHMALWLSLRGDSRAGVLAAEALRVSRRLPGPLSAALAERELLLQSWSLGRLPEGFRHRVRARVREVLACDPVRWEDVALLDLAQAAAEGMARAAGVSGVGLALPDPEAVQVAVEVASRARESLRNPRLQQAVRSGRLTALADEARAWLEGAPVEAAFQLVQLASSACLGGCPHDCLRRRPRTPARAVWEGPCPEPAGEDG